MDITALMPGAAAPDGKPRKAVRRERGASAVEFAIIMPLLFLVIAGIVDFGRAFFTEIQLANSAREGARAAVVLPNPPNTGVAASITARATAAAPGVVDPAGVTLVATCTGNPNAQATVDVSAPFQWTIMRPALALVGATWGLNGTLTSRAVMQCGG
jgi:Flp pilus assembly protein TadG